MRKIDLTNQRFGRLIVWGEFDQVNDHQTRWLCHCDCGLTKIILGMSLKKGLTRSCGCLAQEKRSERLRAWRSTHSTAKHGHARYKDKKPNFSPTYKTWAAMKARCLYKSHEHYKYYGRKGITICKEWINSFETFLADMGERPKGMSIDRINSNLGYSKENCRWATNQEQMENQDSRKYALHENKYILLTELVAITGISYKTLHGKLARKKQLLTKLELQQGGQ